MSDAADLGGDVVVISQLPPPVHGSTLMTRAFLRALESNAIPWRLVDRRFSRTVDEVGKFSLGKVARGLWLVFRVIGTVLRRRPRVVVLFATTRQSSSLVDSALSEALRVLRVPVILYLHTVGFSALAEQGVLQRLAVNRLLRPAKAIVTLDASLAWDVNAFYDGLVEVIGNTLPESPPENVAENPLQARDTVLFLSNLIPGKGHDDFLAVAVRCLEAGLDAKFVLAGAASSSTESEVNEAIARSGWASNISYIGAVGPDAKWKLLRTTRVLVFPSYFFETCGVVLLEAIACGVPITAYRIGGLAPRLEAAGAALVVDLGKPEMLAQAIHELMGSSELSERVRARAREIFSESYSSSAYAASWGRLLGQFGVQSRANEE